jgi:hypothetical protein
MSIDMVNAMDADMSVVREDGTKEYVDNQREDIYVDSTVSDGASDAFARKEPGTDGQRRQDPGGGADEAK